MNTISNIQDEILLKTGIRTSVKKGSGSMRGYLYITPMFQNGDYPLIPFDLCSELKSLLSIFDSNNKPLFCSTSAIIIHGITDDRKEFKKERKPKPIDPDKITKGWGSKNSQMRLDKAIARNVVKTSKGGNARYY